MSRLPWALMSTGWLRANQNATPEQEVPSRTVYNAQTRRYEAVPLPEFQQLLHQGKIQVTLRWNPSGAPPTRVYRLV